MAMTHHQHDTSGAGGPAPRTLYQMSRRRLLHGLGGGSAALVAGAVIPSRRAVTAQTAGSQVEPRAGTWRTWVLSSGSQIAPPAPPDRATLDAELAEVRRLAAGRDAAATAQARFWAAGAPTFRWLEEGLAVHGRLGSGGLGRVTGYVSVAVYDAVIAAWAAKYTHHQPRPAQVDPTLPTVISTPNSPAYPSAHAAAAGAAATVLAYLYPAEAASFMDKAEAAANSRVLAGVQYPSAVAAGLEMGRQVGAAVVEWARADRSDTPFMGSFPPEPGRWSLQGYPQGAVPAGPLQGTWRTWVLTSGDQFRPAPPPAPDSPQLRAHLEEIKSFTRTFATNRAAHFWHPFGMPHWLDILHRKVWENGLDANPPRAARAYALATLAGWDSIIAVFDAKYAYLLIRPFQLDPEVRPLFQTPIHPSYPAAHGTEDGAVDAVLSYLFPADAAYFKGRAEEAANSRVWAGIHYRLDIEAGLELGRRVGQTFVERARQDGADG